MKRVFADTHFHLALLSARDQHHAETLRIVRADEYGEVVTTTWVLAEVADGMRSSHSRQRCALYIARLRFQSDDGAGTRIIGEGLGLFWRGFDLFQKRPDKEWSLTDCISFVVMAEEGLTEALTADHHFEQASFTTLLLAPA